MNIYLIVETHLEANEQIVLVYFVPFQKASFTVIVLQSYVSKSLKLSLIIQQQNRRGFYRYLTCWPIRVHMRDGRFNTCRHCYSTPRGAKIDCNIMSLIVITSQILSQITGVEIHYYNWANRLSWWGRAGLPYLGEFFFWAHFDFKKFATNGIQK